MSKTEAVIIILVFAAALGVNRFFPQNTDRTQWIPGGIVNDDQGWEIDYSGGLPIIHLHSANVTLSEGGVLYLRIGNATSVVRNVRGVIVVG